jgi:hypothetical protein
MSAASRKVSVVLLIVLLPATGYLGWYNYRRIKGGDVDGALPIPFVQQASAQSSSAPPSTSWPHGPTEEGWLVDETARDIAELLGFAKDRNGKVEFAPPVRKDAQTYELRAGLGGSEAKTTLTVADYIWSPTDYTSWAKELLASWKLTPEPNSAAASPELLSTLTDAAPHTLIEQSKRVSEGLSEHPLDASLHEKAALLTAAFAMREAAGEFNDTRRELCRVAAHLAIARALRPAPDNLVRQMADATLQSLAGREAAALKCLLVIPLDAPGTASWVRALRLRSTGNWRLDTDATVPLEFVEGFRARAHSVSSHFAILWAKKQKRSTLHDLQQLVVENDFSVSDGHEFVEDSASEEISALGDDWRDFFGTELQKSEIVKALSEPVNRPVVQTAGQPPTIRVLGWDLWSAQHQRHLCASLPATNHFLRDLWGVDDYQNFERLAKTGFSALTLFPLIERDLMEDSRDVSGLSERVSALIKSHQEVVSPALWEDCLRPSRNNIPALNVISPNNWFSPLVPTGTTYGFWQRCWGYPLPPSEDPFWTRLLAIAPSQYLLRYGQVWKTYGDSPPPGLAEKVYDPILGYNLHALEHLAKTQRKQSAQYPNTMRHVCELDPDKYFDLGDWYLGHSDESKAVEAYLNGADRADDRVHASNLSGWLVNYLDDHGQTDRAMAIATEAANVYSYNGLETMAKLQEKHGHLKEAEDYFAKIAERYGKSDAVSRFYGRHPELTEERDKAIAAAQLKAMVNSLPKVGLSDFKAPPEDGALLTSTSPKATDVGLKSGDVIVAVDGYRVRSTAQYLKVNEMTDSPKIQLIVWSNGGYHEIVAEVPGRHFDFVIRDYTPAVK